MRANAAPEINRRLDLSLAKLRRCSRTIPQARGHPQTPREGAVRRHPGGLPQGVDWITAWAWGACPRGFPPRGEIDERVSASTSPLKFATSRFGRAFSSLSCRTFRRHPATIPGATDRRLRSHLTNLKIQKWPAADGSCASVQSTGSNARMGAPPPCYGSANFSWGCDSNATGRFSSSC